MSSNSVKGISRNVSYKEKVVEIYENFFYGIDISEGREEFWDEFFLLKVNVLALNQLFDKHSLEEIMCLKPHINRLFQKCIDAIKQCHYFRVANSAQTLMCLVNGVFASTTVMGQSTNLVDILVGRDNLDESMQTIVLVCHKALIHSRPYRLKAIMMNLLLTLASASNLLNENKFIEYMLTDEIFEALVIIISDYSYRNILGKEALYLSTILMQHNRYKTNYYRMKMSILEENIVLNGISHLTTMMFVEYIKKSAEVSHKTKGVLSSITSAIGNFLTKPEVTHNINMSDSCFLLSLFDFLQLNVHFSYIMVSSHPVAHSVAPIHNNGILTSRDINLHNIYITLSQEMDVVLENNNYTEESEFEKLSPDPNAIQEDPINMVVVFLEYCSIIMQDLKETSLYNNCRLCFLILLSLAEDQNTANTLHDCHLNLKVTIHRKTMRHRKILLDEENNSTRPLVCGVIDVLVEFMTCHIMKALPADLFNIALNIIHRLVCFQKNKKLRIKYDWKHLWTTLITLTRYLINNYEDMPQKCNVFELINKVVMIFNLFITYGDTFLHSPMVYDDLYYEIIRMSSIFENLYNFVIRASVSKPENKDDISMLLDHLINIKAIINHFNPKIQSWSEENHSGSLSRDQILEIVSANYDSLTLKLHKNLDRYEQYNDANQKEKAFINNLTRSLVVDIRERCFKKSIELQCNLRDILLSYTNPDPNNHEV